MQDSGCQEVELPTTENEDETVQKCKNTCLCLDLCTLRHVIHAAYFEYYIFVCIK